MLIRLSQPVVILFLMAGLSLSCIGQSHRPGVDGMSPSKWITFERTVGFGKVLKTSDQMEHRYEIEDTYLKLWLPVIHKNTFALLVAPQYRSEQLEFEHGQDDDENMLGWKLRSLGLNVKSMITFDSASFLVIAVQANKAGNTGIDKLSDIPLNYSLSSVYLKKLSRDKEYGFGFMLNRAFSRLNILPVVIFNNNFSEKTGIEISLPYKVAFRYNLSKNDRLYLKGEGCSRGYYVNSDIQSFYRRTEADFGISYNRQVNKLIGFELFTGYRKNLTMRMPAELAPVKSSGVAFSFEIFIKPPIR